MQSLVAKSAAFVCSLGAMLFVAGVIVDTRVTWRDYQDPRERLLWDGRFDGSSLVLLGDSEFCSFYVDSPDQTIWAKLAERTGQQVFPGALNGAKPDDLLAAATHVAAEWPPQTVVFVNIAPTRFLRTHVDEPPLGNYPETFFKRYGIDIRASDPVRKVEGFVYGSVLKPFFIVRHRDVLAGIVDRPRYFRERGHRNRVWSADIDFARKRFEMFERNVDLDDARPLDWLATIRSILEAKGMRVAFVMTPLNEALIRALAPADRAERIATHARNVNQNVLRHLQSIGADVIDVRSGMPSECFADLVHTNVCGDAVIANRMADWLAAARVVSR